MRLSAIGKYPHITASEERLHYGELLVGASGEECEREVGVRAGARSCATRPPLRAVFTPPCPVGGAMLTVGGRR